MIASELIAVADSLREMTNGNEILDAVENKLGQLGADHILVTGFPLPGRPIEPLILRLNWGELRQDRGGGSALRADDALIQHALRARRPFTWADSTEGHLSGESLLMAELGTGTTRIVGVPICAFLPYQAVVIAAGAHFAIEQKALLAADILCAEAFRRLLAMGYLRPERPGELSARERRVVELSAFGKTASQIATILDISQRTVHAHLQNASEKLRASNKTQTVVEALRYGQISV